MDFIARTRLLGALAALALSTPGVARADPSLTLQPERARPGDALLVTVREAAEAPEGALGDRPLLFYPIDGGFRALAALPVETAPGSIAVAVSLNGAPALRATLAVEEPHWAEAELAVAPRFIEPPPEARRRMKRDQAAFDKAFAQPFGPPLFRDPFAWPLEAEITGRFGDKRLFNGKKQSQHYGDDLSGAEGAPVAAANDGKVVLVRDCYASGRSVVLSHGAGLFTVYFHLSRIGVKTGAEVRRGERIGLVGRTGRVTGPHLHWGTKVGGLYVDPESILRLPFQDGR
jgi:murein DD-endopeptidase MepM/ murein hydrolase activator NlpD